MQLGLSGLVTVWLNVTNDLWLQGMIQLTVPDVSCALSQTAPRMLAWAAKQLEWNRQRVQCQIVGLFRLCLELLWFLLSTSCLVSALSEAVLHDELNTWYKNSWFQESFIFSPLFGVCYNINGIWPKAKAGAMLDCSHFWKGTKSRRYKRCQKRAALWLFWQVCLRYGMFLPWPIRFLLFCLFSPVYL